MRTSGGGAKPGQRYRTGRWLALLLIISVFSAKGATITPLAEATANNSQSSLTQLPKHYLAVNDNPTREFIDAKAYLLMDGANGNVLLENDYDVPVSVGSTTKMITALTASQLYPPDKVITVSQFAANINGSSVGLIAGEEITVANLLRALLIPSGNDAAYALATAYSTKEGDYQSFVAEMNKFATAHHLKKSNYQDPAGLADEGTTTAFDLAQTGRLIMNNPVLSEIVRSPNATITNQAGKRYELKNTDQLLQVGNPAYYNRDVIGIKTGFTPLAGYCLVAAENFHDHLLMAVVLGVPGNGETASAKEINALYRWAEQNITVKSY